MTKLLVCIDGSLYADNICAHAAWAAKKLGAEIDLLHVLRRHSDYQALADDHTGTIGMDARCDLMDELTKVDEERGKFDQQKGRLILEHGEKAFQSAGLDKVNTIHRRGSLSETIKEMEDNIDMIFIGKRGEQANQNSEFLGSNLEKVARLVHKPLFVVSRYMKPIQRFAVAYDGKENTNKAIEYITSSPLLKGLECHLLTVENSGPINITDVAHKLQSAGFDVKSHHEKSDDIDDVIAKYVEGQKIDLMLTGAYSHSRIHDVFLGSTTSALIKKCHVPFILFR